MAEAGRHRGAIWWVSFRADGQYLVTASQDHSARVWDASTGAPIAPFLAHQGTVYEAWFTPDGARVVTASADGTARLWDSVSGEPLAPPFRHRAQVKTARFSPDGLRLLTASFDGTAQLWELPTLDWPAEDILTFAELNAVGTIGSSDKLMPLEPDVLEARWRCLRTKYPKTLTVEADADVAWHRRQVTCAELACEAFAGLFHLDQL